jgi:hypothetical protein
MNPIYNRSELAYSGREAVPAPHVAPIVINIMMGHNSCTLNTTLVFHEINMSSIIPYDVKRQLLTLYTLILRIQRRNR